MLVWKCHRNPGKDFKKYSGYRQKTFSNAVTNIGVYIERKSHKESNCYCEWLEASSHLLLQNASIWPMIALLSSPKIDPKYFLCQKLSNYKIQLKNMIFSRTSHCIYLGNVIVFVMKCLLCWYVVLKPGDQCCKPISLRGQIMKLSEISSRKTIFHSSLSLTFL